MMKDLQIQKCGSLCFWGDWFGRPMDNYHIPVSADYDEERGIFTICFNEGERCTVYAPRGVVNEPKDFHIQSARKIVWEWYYCGREQTPEYLYRRVYDRNNMDLTMTEYRGEQIVRSKRIGDWRGEPAVAIC